MNRGARAAELRMQGPGPESSALQQERGKNVKARLFLVLAAAGLIAAACSSSAAPYGPTGGDNGAYASAAPTAAPVAGRADGVPAPETKQGAFTPETGSGGVVLDQAIVPTDTTQIVRTGSMVIEVQDLDKALAQAKSTIVGMGGYISDSSQSGDKDSAVATVTYRFPVTKWDDALVAMRGLSSRLINEQTNSTDVTSQVVDLEARLSNLQSTESALQGIMARASAIPDVLAVENQLSNVRGQIEQLTAQRDHLKNLAAMSTLSVTFETPTTVTVQATKDWDLGAQVDEAVAALIHIGQWLATAAVWAVIVGGPLLLGLLVLLVAYRLARRVRRGKPQAAAEA